MCGIVPLIKLLAFAADSPLVSRSLYNRLQPQRIVDVRPLLAVFHVSLHRLELVDLVHVYIILSIITIL